MYPESGISEQAKKMKFTYLGNQKINPTPICFRIQWKTTNKAKSKITFWIKMTSGLVFKAFIFMQNKLGNRKILKLRRKAWRCRAWASLSVKLILIFHHHPPKRVNFSEWNHRLWLKGTMKQKKLGDWCGRWSRLKQKMKKLGKKISSWDSRKLSCHQIHNQWKSCQWKCKFRI